MKTNIKLIIRGKRILRTIPNYLGLLILLVIFPTSCINSQNAKSTSVNSDTLFTVQELNDDFGILRNALEEGHAGLYRYTPKEKLDKLFETISQSLVRPMSEMNFLLKLQPIIANIQCGHTRIGLSKGGNDSLNKQLISIPFSFKFIKNKTYFLYNYSNLEDLKMGAEIISINGNSINDIIQNMLPLISSDAYIKTSKYHYLEKSNNFSRYYALLYGKNTSFLIKYISPINNKEKIIKVRCINKKTLEEVRNNRYPELAKKLPPISVVYNNGIPILKIRTFNSIEYSELSTSYQEFLKNTFNEFKEKGIQNLIIDLRNNNGGDDVYGKILVSYLFDKTFNYYNKLEFKKTSYDFLKHTNIQPEDWEAYTKNIQKNPNGLYEYIDHPNLGEQKNLNPYFNGKVYILMNGGSFSTTGEALSIIHYNKKAIFVGEECGAAYYGSNSGIIPVLTLPSTKIRLSIPLFKYTMAVNDNPTNRGIVPDYPIFIDIMDLIDKKDSETEFLLKLITEK